MNDSQLEDYKNTFNLFDTTKSGTISIDDVLKSIKSLGLNPSSESVLEISKQVLGEDTTQIKFEDFVKIANMFRQQVQREELTKSFQVLDSNKNGMIVWNDFSSIMRECGATPEELEFMREKFKVEGDTFDYKKVIENFNKYS